MNCLLSKHKDCVPTDCNRIMTRSACRKLKSKIRALDNHSPLPRTLKKSKGQHNRQHESKARPSKAKELLCDICGHVSSDVSSMQEHKQQHPKRPICFCTLCDRAFFQFEDLEAHVCTCLKNFKSARRQNNCEIRRLLCNTQTSTQTSADEPDISKKDVDMADSSSQKEQDVVVEIVPKLEQTSADEPEISKKDVDMEDSSSQKEQDVVVEIVPKLDHSTRNANTDRSPIKNRSLAIEECFLCDRCGLSFMNLEDLTKHEENHNSTDEVSDTVSAMELCESLLDINNKYFHWKKNGISRFNMSNSLPLDEHWGDEFIDSVTPADDAEEVEASVCKEGKSDESDSPVPKREAAVPGCDVNSRSPKADAVKSNVDLIFRNQFGEAVPEPSSPEKVTKSIGVVSDNMEDTRDIENFLVDCPRPAEDDVCYFEISTIDVVGDETHMKRISHDSLETDCSVDNQQGVSIETVASDPGTTEESETVMCSHCMGWFTATDLRSHVSQVQESLTISSNRPQLESVPLAQHKEQLVTSFSPNIKTSSEIMSVRDQAPENTLSSNGRNVKNYKCFKDLANGQRTSINAKFSCPCSECVKNLQKEHRPKIKECHICGKAVEISQHSQHVKLHSAVRTNQDASRCDICAETFSSMLALADHQYTKHVADYSTNEHFQLKCPHCKELSNSTESFIAHVATHTGVYPFECSVCGQGYLYKFVLQIHMACHYLG